MSPIGRGSPDVPLVRIRQWTASRSCSPSSGRSASVAADVVGPRDGQHRSGARRALPRARRPRVACSADRRPRRASSGRGGGRRSSAPPAAQGRPRRRAGRRGRQAGERPPSPRPRAPRRSARPPSAISAARSGQVCARWASQLSRIIGTRGHRRDNPARAHSPQGRTLRGGALRADRVASGGRVRGHPLREGRGDREDHDQPPRGPKRLSPADARRAARRLRPRPRRPRGGGDHLHRRRRRGVLLRRRPADPRRRRLHRRRRGRPAGRRPPRRRRPARPDPPHCRSPWWRWSPATRWAAATSCTSSAT